MILQLRTFDDYLQSMDQSARIKSIELLIRSNSAHHIDFHVAALAATPRRRGESEALGTASRSRLSGGAGFVATAHQLYERRFKTPAPGPAGAISASRWWAAWAPHLDGSVWASMQWPVAVAFAGCRRPALLQHERVLRLVIWSQSDVCVPQADVPPLFGTVRKVCICCPFSRQPRAFTMARRRRMCCSAQHTAAARMAWHAAISEPASGRQPACRRARPRGGPVLPLPLDDGRRRTGGQGRGSSLAPPQNNSLTPML